MRVDQGGSPGCGLSRVGGVSRVRVAWVRVVQGWRCEQGAG